MFTYSPCLISASNTTSFYNFDLIVSPKRQLNSVQIMTPPNHDSSSTQRATATRDATPLPNAARRVIRNQRGGDIHSIHGTQSLQRDTLSPSRATRRVLTPQMQQAHGSLGSSQRLPTLQEMYNTWRSLEEQFSQMRRLPMFVKAELKFCHGCRILKIRVRAYQLENNNNKIPFELLTPISSVHVL